MNEWSVVQEKAIREDGTLLFPERLTREFLDQQRRVMGTYLWHNQYQNEVLPEDEKRFKKSWLRYYATLPDPAYTFGFIDPAIGQNKHHDYTGIVVVDVDADGAWYVRVANRYRMTPTEIVAKMFELQAEFKLKCLGVEIVAYQEALLYMLDQEMRKRKVILPVKGIKRTSMSKETRILGLVPRFEWARISLAQGLVHLEDEYHTFPRGHFDDLLDALSSLEEIIHYPQRKEDKLERPHSYDDPNYERWHIKQLSEKAQSDSDEYGG